MKAVIARSIHSLEAGQEEFLKKLGVSDHELQVYTVMLSQKQDVSAQDITNYIMVFPNAVYRVFKRLEEMGLIQFVGRRPIRYRAVDISQGLSNAYQTQKTALEAQLRALTNEAQSNHVMHTLVGRQRMYEEYIKLARSARHEVAVFAIGIAYSKELLQVQKQTLQRGVYIRHVVQQLRPSNYAVVAKWERLGVAMRYFKEEKGFHLTLVDKEVAMVTFSDPANTEDRFTIVTRQPFAVRLFQAQFEAIWQQAQPIDIYK